MRTFFQRRAAIEAGLVILTVGVVAHADPKPGASEAYCAAVAALDSYLAELNAIGPHSTVAELRAATSRIERDATEMQKVAGKMKTPAAKEFNVAVKKLKQDVNNIPDDATLEQVRTKIRDDAQSTQNTGQQLASESGCPQSPPTQQTP